MKFITFQKFSLNHIFFLAYFVISRCRSKLTDSIFELKTQKSGYFFMMYLTIISHFLSIIPHLIIKYLSRRQTTEKIKRSKNENQLIFNDADDYKGRGLLRSTLLVSIFDFLADALINIFYFFNDDRKVYSTYTLNTYLIFNTFIQYITSHLILKTYFYKHHYLSFFINFFCCIITLIIDIIKIADLKVTEYKYYIFVFMRLIRLTLYGVGDAFSKMALYSAFLSSYSLLLFKALYETTFLIFFSIPFIFIKTSDLYVNDESIFIGFKEYLTGIKLLYSILLFIADFLYDLVLLIIIDKFSPSHLPLAYIFESFGFSIYSLIDYANKGRKLSWSLLVQLPIYIILFVGAMIHNEIIIVNKCELNLKTKLYLDARFEEEKLNSDLNQEGGEEEEIKQKEENKRKEIMMQEMQEN